MSIRLTRAQQDALSFYFSANNPYIEDKDFEEAEFEVEIRDVATGPASEQVEQYLYINGTYLYHDGEWGTPHPSSYRGTRT